MSGFGRLPPPVRLCPFWTDPLPPRPGTPLWMAPIKDSRAQKNILRGLKVQFGIKRAMLWPIPKAKTS